MKKLRTALALLAALCILLAAAGSGAETYVEAGGYNPDQMTYQGYWSNIYLQVLQNHSAAIYRYQGQTIDFWENGISYHVPCHPVGLRDLDGDGIPELLFLEATADGSRGDLWVYSANGSTGRCVLYVPGITRLDYDNMLGFQMYLAYSGSTLVIKHYKYENEWYLQFYVNRSGRYDLLDYMTVRGDYSGEGNDVYIRNGAQISEAEYFAARDALDNTQKTWISQYFSYGNTAYGLDYTYENAAAVLGASYIQPTEQPRQQQQSGRAVYGLTIDKLATRKGPGTQYEGGGTYSVKGQYIQVLAKAYDNRNGIWWVKCVIPYHGENRILWTGWKRFDHSTISLDDLPEEVW